MKFNRTIEQLAADVKRRVSESDSARIPKEHLIITDKEVVVPRMFIASGKWRAFVAVKRALKMGLGAGISAFVASGNPIAGLIAGGGVALLGGGEKYITETRRAEGKSTGWINVIDTVLKILLELIRYARGSSKRKG